MQRIRIVPLMLTLAGLAPCVQAEDTRESAPTAAQPPSGEAMRVYIDPETGELTHAPVTEQQRRDAAADNANDRDDDANVRVVHHADGSTTAYLDGRFEQSMVVAAEADGTLKAHCADADHASRGQHDHPETATDAAGVERNDR